MKIILGDVNAKSGTWDIFKLTKEEQEFIEKQERKKKKKERKKKGAQEVHFAMTETCQGHKFAHCNTHKSELEQ